MTNASYTPILHPVTGLEHHVMPKVRTIVAPQALLYVGNSFFFFNNGTHRCVRRLLQKAPTPPKFRCNMVAINGASLSWHDVESYFRPHAISSYSFNENNEVVFRDPESQLWDALLLHDSSQGPIHPEMSKDFAAFAQKDAEICRAHKATPIFVISWAYSDKPEMTAQLADAITTVANDNDAMAVPVGLAWALARQKRPDVPLYIGDKRHPTMAGTYLASCTIIASLFGIDVREIDFDTEVEPDLARFLRETAQETVTRFFSRG